MDYKVSKRKLITVGVVSFMTGGILAPSLTSATYNLTGQAKTVALRVGDMLKEQFEGLFKEFTGSMEKVRAEVESHKDVTKGTNEKIENAVKTNEVEIVKAAKGLVNDFKNKDFEAGVSGDISRMFKNKNGGVHGFFTGREAKTNNDNLQHGVGLDLSGNEASAEKQQKIYDRLKDNLFHHRKDNASQRRADMVAVSQRRSRLMQDTVKTGLATAVYQQDALGSQEYNNTVDHYVNNIRQSGSHKDLSHTQNTLLLEVVKELRQQRQLMAFMLQMQAAEHMQRMGTVDNDAVYDPKPESKDADKHKKREQSLTDMYREVEKKMRAR